MTTQAAHTSRRTIHHLTIEHTHTSHTAHTSHTCACAVPLTGCSSVRSRMEYSVRGAVFNSMIVAVATSETEPFAICTIGLCRRHWRANYVPGNSCLSINIEESARSQPMMYWCVGRAFFFFPIRVVDGRRSYPENIEAGYEPKKKRKEKTIESSHHHWFIVRTGT